MAKSDEPLYTVNTQEDIEYKCVLYYFNLGKSKSILTSILKTDLIKPSIIERELEELLKNGVTWKDISYNKCIYDSSYDIDFKFVKKYKNSLCWETITTNLKNEKEISESFIRTFHTFIEIQMLFSHPSITMEMIMEYHPDFLYSQYRHQIWTNPNFNLRIIKDNPKIYWKGFLPKSVMDRDDFTVDIAQLFINNGIFAPEDVVVKKIFPIGLANIYLPKILENMDNARYRDSCDEYGGSRYKYTTTTKYKSILEWFPIFSNPNVWDYMSVNDIYEYAFNVAMYAPKEFIKKYMFDIEKKFNSYYGTEAKNRMFSKFIENKNITIDFFDIEDLNEEKFMHLLRKDDVTLEFIERYEKKIDEHKVWHWIKLEKFVNNIEFIEKYKEKPIKFSEISEKYVTVETYEKYPELFPKFKPVKQTVNKVQQYDDAIDWYAIIYEKIESYNCIKKSELNTTFAFIE